MAIFTAGPAIAEIRGSQGGTTFSRNRHGQYTRQRSTPVNPNSPAQILARQRFNALATRWRDTLTPAQRAAWELYADNTAWSNGVGEETKLTGINHYIRSNGIALLAGQSIYDDAPGTFGIPDQEDAWTVTADATTQKVDVAYTFDVDVDDLLYAFFTGRPIDPSRNFYGGPWRYLGMVLGDATTPPSSPASFDSQHVLSSGQSLHVYCRRLDVDGRLTEPFRRVAAVTAS
jgi:hypothetical protein